MTKQEITVLRREAHVLRAGAGGNKVARQTARKLEALADKAETKNERNRVAVPWFLSIA